MKALNVWSAAWRINRLQPAYVLGVLLYLGWSLGADYPIIMLVNHFYPAPSYGRGIFSAQLLRFCLGVIYNTGAFLFSLAIYRMALCEWRGGLPSSKEMVKAFHFWKEALWISFGATIVYFAVELALFSVPRTIESIVISTALYWLAFAPFCFVLPLVADEKRFGLEAVRASFAAFSRNPFQVLLLSVLAAIFAWGGMILCIVGALLTLAFYQIAITRAYLETFEPADCKT